MTRTMRKWTARLAGGLIAVTGLGMVGCKHQLLNEPADADVLRRPNIPAGLETHPHAPITPPAPVAGTDPATVLDFKRKPRPISLKEAVAVASEQGNVGGGGGSGQDSLVLQSTGRAISGDTIKAFVLDPAAAAAEVERSLSKFDARWITSMSWSKQDQATLTLQQSFSNGDNAAFSTTLAKPLPTGGVAGITTSINYLNLSNPPPASSGFVALSTSYTPRVQFVFEQPLLQGFGVEANQLLSNHPGSVGLIQGFRTSGQGTEGILITRLRQEQARTQFDVLLNQLLVNVEVAYWNLYAEYANLAAQQDGLLAAFEALVYIRERDIAGVEVVRTQLPLYEGQYHQFYQRVVDARGRVLEADRVLRGLMGLRSDDGTVFTPTDEPVRTPFTFDYQAAYREGLQTRPEVMIARQDLKVQQLNYRTQQIGRMPDLRLFSSYDVNGLGGRFAGDNSALSSLAANQFNSWQVGLRLDMPLGFRDANALVREAQIALWRSYLTLSDAERKVYEGLVQAKRQLDQAYVSIETNRRAKAAARRQVDIINERVRAGAIADSAQYLQLAQAQQNLATFQAAEYRAVADYNAALARIEFAKGTSQRYNNVSVADGPLPGFVQTKAADHFRERQAALKLREHPADNPTAGGFTFLSPEQMPAPADVMTAPGMPLPPAIPAPAPGPGLTPPAKDASPAGDPGKSPISTIKTWDKWETAPGSTGSLPANLPPLPKVTPSSQSPAGGGFIQDGTLTLPPKRAIGDGK